MNKLIGFTHASAELHEDIMTCQMCAPHLPLAPKPIIQFNPAARILIAGQAPGLRAHQSGRPFDDASGDRLRDWLGLSPAQFYDPQLLAILPMGFCYPGKGPSGDNPPYKECATTWRRPLLKQLSQLSLTLVIGQYALAYHVGAHKGSLTEQVRQQALDETTLILPHPSPRNNIWLKKNPWFELEILPALKQKVQLAISV
ncbi:uracil-DNA glycosylase family protein [Pseudoalteromonas ulvae]|uniref:Uracil-DNA glycosylase-like domain-containing protein n=1 Tax=Pseudoalteromonas ulvae TaxID=107327 RepID=A0A244CLY0_PSEDV|nr:uracil-DNA glycosylase family protein [Pseudoalteromonas ulvae]OUL56558.1 hypothetical protein B1199_18025 [Pseudoalteromonas ulvae]